jgi:hypothetical protein
MPIAVDCPGCRKRYEVEISLAGKKSRCKQCGAVFRIPAMIVIDCPGCRKRYELSEALAGKKSRCRQCGEVFTIAAAHSSAPEPETRIEPETRSVRSAQPPPELYWEVLGADDTGKRAAAVVPNETKLPDHADFDLPPPPRAPTRSTTFKARSAGGDTSLGVTVSGWFSVALFALFAAMYGAGAVGLLSKSQVRGFTGISLALTMIACSVLILWGTIWLVVIAFREEARCGLMFLFVPFYAIYYMLTRLAETKGPASMVAVAYFVIIGMPILGPAVDPDRVPGTGNNEASRIASAAPGIAPPLGAGPDWQQAKAFPMPGGNAAPFGPRRARPAPAPNVGVPGPPPAFLASLDSQIQAFHGRYGNRAVVFAFRGIPTNSDPARGITGREVWEAIRKRIKELAPGIESEMSYSIDDHRALIVAPIDNPAELANRIDFGKATVKNGTRIVVDVSPEFVASVPRLAPEQWQASVQPGPAEPEIPADADPVTRSLIQLKSSDMAQKKDAVHRLERTKPDNRLAEVVAALLPLLNDDDGFLVNDVMKTLLVWRSPDVLPAIIERARDNRFFVRKEAVKALGKFQDTRAVEAIIPHFQEDGFEAEAALKEIGPMAEPALIARLRDPDRSVRSRACDILAQVGGVETLKAMRAIPTDQDLGVRMAAKRAAEQIVARVGLPPRGSSHEPSNSSRNKGQSGGAR